MAKTLICPTCGGPSINKGIKFALGQDGIMHPVRPMKCNYLGGFSGRIENKSRAFWCSKNRGIK